MFGTGNKPSGIEMMISAVMKTMGVTPEVLTGTIEQFKSLAGQFVAAMQGMNQRMANIEKQNAQILLLLTDRANATHEAPGPVLIGVGIDGTGNGN